ncbi:MAG TPA: TadE/TadG family type IV pilus assembly protein [Terriglobia bacterium]|nr:TadE/TadG family type IV pilus assembly protein [Terriglobia bacterium]
MRRSPEGSPRSVRSFCCRSRNRRGLWGWLAPLLGERGTQLLELAITMPSISLVIVGVSDFGGAFLIKHKLGNAAREASRIVISSPLSDSSCSDSTPCSIEAAADATVQYLNGIGLSASCITPSAPTSSGTLTWTWTCASGLSLTINRGYTYTGTGGIVVSATQITLTYPYTWTFSSFFKLQGLTLPSSVTTKVVMENLT